MTETDQLEGVKEIAWALRCSERTARRYIGEGTSTRLPLPAKPNFRARLSCTRALIAEWCDGGRFLRASADEASVDEAPPSVARPTQRSAPNAPTVAA